jgi:hypothetical protein
MKRNLLYTRLATGTPVTSEDLAALGISADLAVHYVRAGWLQRLARGVYCRPNDPPALHPSLVLLQRSFEGLHVGGKSALDWHVIRHYVSQRPVLHLYGWKAGRLPPWFTERFPAEYHRKRLFKEKPGASLRRLSQNQPQEAWRVPVCGSRRRPAWPHDAPICPPRRPVVASIGLDPLKYGTHSLRRTKATADLPANRQPAISAAR